MGPPVGDKAVGDKAVGDKAVGDKAVGDKAVGDQAAGEDRVLTIPNAVTVARLCLLPLFIWLLLSRHERYGAAWVLAAMGTTDWIDGYLARHLHQVSTVGKVLDPVADRLLLIGGIGAILIDGHSAPTWVAILVIARELLVAVTVLALAALGAKRIDVTWWGKAAAFGQMVAFPLFMTGHSNASWHRIGEDLAWVFFGPGMIFGIYSLLLYIPLARKALADGRRARESTTAEAQP